MIGVSEWCPGGLEGASYEDVQGVSWPMVREHLHSAARAHILCLQWRGSTAQRGTASFNIVM